MYMYIYIYMYGKCRGIHIYVYIYIYIYRVEILLFQTAKHLSNLTVARSQVTVSLLPGHRAPRWRHHDVSHHLASKTDGQTVVRQT